MDHRIDVGDCRLFVRTIGERNARRPWLVLSNCIAGDQTMWDAEVEWLARTHRVLLYDTRGHGDSEAPGGDLTFADLVGDVVALMDRFEIEKAAFLGLSLGGMTGLGLALSHPARLRHLVCCNARADAPAAVVETWEKRIHTIQAEGLAALESDTLERWVRAGPGHGSAAATARLTRMFRRTSAAGYIACARALQHLDYRRALAEIRVPTLFVAGADDMAAPAAVMKDMAAAVPEASFAVIPATRHLSNIDNPRHFRGAVEAFLTGATAD